MASQAESLFNSKVAMANGKFLTHPSTQSFQLRALLFSPSTDIASQTQLKFSVQRGIRSSLISQYPLLGENDGAILEQIWPKKKPLVQVKCRGYVSLYTLDGVPVFSQHSNGPFFLTLKLLHQYPSLLPHLQVDRGAIKYLLAGANMMCPGFTSAGGRLPPPESAIPAKTLVAIHCEGKEHAAGIGITKLGTEEMKKVNKGVGVDIMAYLGDELWVIEKI
ncbi:uncharacterized protein EI90DRAFT_3280228 [Cantharellus anzutake]|uniref:uncharacterized protein n=1 Tax=Cantharellus anzutake TaxID=1750568 RepID=UPI001902FAF9|nr:uncharacterized protein EI90DRAFT_3280228 [Cantharellus anzutake]KAF8333997.1 hypothetical protein EI90DRAFT_3280228 [Cantharellus anzutake]